MSKLFDTWENRFATFDSLIPASPNPFLLSTILTSKALKTKVASKTTLSESGALSYPSLTGINELNLTYSPFPLTSYSLSHKNDQTTLTANIPLLNKHSHLISTHPKVSFSFQHDKLSSFPVSCNVRYLMHNSTLFSLGIEDYDYTKNKIGGMLKLYGLHGKQLENGMKLFGGLCLGYDIKDKQTKNINCVLSFTNNDKFKTIIDYDMKLQNKPSTIDTKQGNNAHLRKFILNSNKVINIKTDNKINNALLLGLHSVFNITSNSFKNIVFMNYKFNSFTNMKAKWEDNNKSITLMLNQNFIDIMSVTVSGQITPVQNDARKCVSPAHKWLVPYKTKFGVSLEFKGGLF